MRADNNRRSGSSVRQHDQPGRRLHPGDLLPGEQRPGDPVECKYDAFKIQEGNAPSAFDLTVVKDASGTYDKIYSWGLTKTSTGTVPRSRAGARRSSTR